MPRKVTTAPIAAEGLRQARLWLTQPGSGADGRRRWERLRNARRNLRIYPYLGAPNDEQPGYYQLVVSGHRVIYRIDPDTGDSNTAGDIRILIILGPGQA